MNIVYHLKQPLSEVMEWSPRDRSKSWEWLRKQRDFEQKKFEKKR